MTEYHCPECSGDYWPGDPAGLRFDHRGDCSIREREDATAAADHERLKRLSRFSRVITLAERELLEAIQVDPGDNRTYVRWAGVVRREWPKARAVTPAE